MSKFTKSRESVDTSLLLWQENPTQIAIEETYDVMVHPVSSIFNEGSINFDLPSQPKGMLSNVEVVTTFTVKNGGNNLETADQVSIVNNIGSAIWGLVDVKIDDRVSLMQSMQNAYAYQTFFNNVLNHDSTHAKFLYANELFMMDSGTSKNDSESLAFGATEDDVIKNLGAAQRSKRIKTSKSITTFTKLHCSLLTTHKALPSSMKIRVSLTKNSDKFLLLARDGSDYRINIQTLHLVATYHKPRDVVLKTMENKLRTSPAIYNVTRPEIIVRPIVQTSRVIRVNDLFHDKLPKYAFFCIQGSQDFDGALSKNPFAFIPFRKFQFYVNGTPYFVEPIEITPRINGSFNIYDENAAYLRQLYKTIGKELRGDCLIDRDNFQLNFIVGLSLTSDRCNTLSNHLNLQENASTHLEIDMGDERLPIDPILVIYALFDRQIEISFERTIHVVE